MKKIIVSVISFFLLTIISCDNNNSIKGKYYNVSTQTVYEFNNSSIQIFNLLDSTQTFNSIKVKNNEIKWETQKEESIILDFVKDKDTLILFDYYFKIFDDELVKLQKLESNNNIRIETFYNNYWKLILNKKNDTLLIKISDSLPTGYEYRKLSKLGKGNIFFNGNFHVNKYNYFNTFYVYRFQSFTFPDTDYLIERVTKDSLILFDLKTMMRLKFSNYKSTINDFIFGTWKEVNNKKEALIIPNGGALISFGDTISMNRDYAFRRNVSYNSINESYRFHFGLDSKYIFIDELDYGEVRIIKATRDSLILENPYMRDENRKSLLMKYIRVKTG